MFKSQTLMKQQQLIESLTRENETLRQRVETLESDNRRLRDETPHPAGDSGTERDVLGEAKRALEERYTSLLILFDRFRRVIGEERREERPTEIGRNIDTLLEQVETFRQSVSKIRKISNELELLGVNATIQAAHAGEEGKGFLIVADEISKLSGHSKKSVEEALQQLRLFTEITRSLSEDFSQSVVYIEKNLDRFDALEALVQEHLPKENSETQDRM